MNKKTEAFSGLDLGSLSGEELLGALRPRQAGLPWSATIGLVMEGLRVRLGRSLITLVAVVLAVGFLVQTSLSGQLVKALVDQVAVLELSKSPTDEAIARAQDLRKRLHAAGVSIESRAQDEAQTRWLTFMALLVCTVGIANAMLMSVTERFWEIGTMKCLGANEYLIVRMFLLEAAAMGVAGAVGGFVLGLGLEVLLAAWQFGGLEVFPWTSIPLVFGISVLAGAFLAVVGAIYPVVLAARMKPVEALRVEE